MASGRADNYRTALISLEQQKADYLNQIKDLDDLIAGIAKQIEFIEGRPATHSSADAPVVSQVPEIAGITPTTFKNMSVRWGVLKLFGERQVGLSLTTNEIAKNLENGGVESTGQRFVGNVSAVVSTMKAKGEIESVNDGRYRATTMGRQSWDHIRRSPKYQARLSPSVS